MRELSIFKRVSFFAFWAIFISCSTTTDINNEVAVMKDVQGAWVGSENTGEMYRHIKLSVDKDSFKGWVQTSDSNAEPVWADQPNEEGTISLSSLQEDPGNKIKFRKFTFTCSGRCCGDKSLSLEAMSKLITYEDGKGLTLAGLTKMARE